MNKVKLIVAMVIAIVLLIGIAWTFQPLQVGDTTISFGFGSGAKAMLRKLGLPEGATDLSGIDVTAADGTLPEIALRSFTTNKTPSALHAFYLGKCLEHALSRPDDGRLKVEPEMICHGRGETGTFGVYLYPLCEGEWCNAHVEVRYVHTK